MVWGFTSGLAQFLMMAMFVQGFWFGAKFVREHKIGAGDVMAVFSACLIAASNLQMCIPQFIVLANGKFAIASLLGLVTEQSTPSPSVSILLRFSWKIHPLRKIIPSKCSARVEQRLVCLSLPTYLDRSQRCFLVPPSQRNDFHCWFVWFWQIHHRTTVDEDV